MRARAMPLGSARDPEQLDARRRSRWDTLRRRSASPMIRADRRYPRAAGSREARVTVSSPSSERSDHRDARGEQQQRGEPLPRGSDASAGASGGDGARAPDRSRTAGGGTSVRTRCAHLAPDSTSTTDRVPAMVTREPRRVRSRAPRGSSPTLSGPPGGRSRARIDLRTGPHARVWVDPDPAGVLGEGLRAAAGLTTARRSPGASGKPKQRAPRPRQMPDVAGRGRHRRRPGS